VSKGKRMAKDAIINCKVEEAMKDLISKVAFDLDRNASEFIRCCILLSMDTVKAMPSLIDTVQFYCRKDNNT
jgi:hypothetical protein